jgi:hypothetical protein
MWILKNSKELLENFKSRGFSKIDSIKTYDVSTLYTTIPHNKLMSWLFQIIDNCFWNKNGTREYKFLVIGRQDAYFVRHHSNSPYKYSEADIKSMLGFLVDNIYVVFGDQVYQQSVGIPMGTNCAPLLADYMRQNLFRNCYRIITKKTSRVLQPYIKIYRWCPINQ